MDAPPKTIRYHYIKSNAFRVVHADGVYGGLSPKGHLHLDFFSERFPIPQYVDHELLNATAESGRIGKEVTRVAREGLIREVEVGVVMDLEAAATLRDWLSEHIDKWKKLQGPDNAK